MLMVKDFRTERSLTHMDCVRVPRERYPGYDKHLHSKVEQPDKYGIRLLNEAEGMLEDAFARTAPQPRKRDCRRLPARVQCRMAQGEFARLQQALRRDGFETVQGGLLYIIRAYLDGRKGE